jgi:hypothetical protein
MFPRKDGAGRGQARVKRRCKRPPASAARRAAWQPPSGARPNRGDPPQGNTALLAPSEPRVGCWSRVATRAPRRMIAGRGNPPHRTRLIGWLGYRLFRFALGRTRYSSVIFRGLRFHRAFSRALSKEEPGSALFVWKGAVLYQDLLAAF